MNHEAIDREGVTVIAWVRPIKRNATLDSTSILKSESVVSRWPRVYLHLRGVLDTPVVESLLELRVISAGIHHFE